MPPSTSSSSIADLLDSGPVPIARVRDDARRTLVDLLDESPGRKTLVIEPAIATWLGLMAEVPLLKEHGVDQLLLLGENGAPRLTSSSSSNDSSPPLSVVFVARARPASAAAIAACVVAASSSSPSSTPSSSSSFRKSSQQQQRKRSPSDFRALFAPRVDDGVRQALAAGGALGSLTLSPLRVRFLPVEPDVLSLEDPGAFAEATGLGCGYGGDSLGKAAAAGGDPRPAKDFASALVSLSRSNKLLGVPRVVRGVGPAASVVRAALDLARKGADAEVADEVEEEEVRRERTKSVDEEDDENDDDENSLFPLPGTGPIDEWLIIDRLADPVTPLATQLTYEGLARETVEVRAGAAFVESADASSSSSDASTSSSSPSSSTAAKARVPLSAGDPVFRDLRDASFAAAGPSLGARAKEIQSGYQAARGGGGGGGSDSVPDSSENPASPSSSSSNKNGASLSELRALAGSLKLLPSIQRHVALAEAVGAAVASPLFRARMEAEQRLLTLSGIQSPSSSSSSLVGGVGSVLGGGSGAADAAAASAAEAAVDAAESLLIRDGTPRAVDSALRLLCLATVAAGGIPRKRWDSCRREVLLTAGPEAAAALVGLERAGLLRCAGGTRRHGDDCDALPPPPPMPPAVLPPAAFSALRRFLRLVSDPGEDPRVPRDASYVYAGFAPISSRLAAAAAAAAVAAGCTLSAPLPSSAAAAPSPISVPRSWTLLPGMSEAVKALPQPCFESILGVDARDGATPTDAPLSSSISSSTSSSSPAPRRRPRRILVCFVGGCTHAEVSALRWLSASAQGRAAVAALAGSGRGGGGGGSASVFPAPPPPSASATAAGSSSSPAPFEFVVATSAMLTGDELVRSFDPPAVSGLRATVAAV